MTSFVTFYNFRQIQSYSLWLYCTEKRRCHL